MPTRLTLEYFSHRAARPATTGQHAAQCGVAGANGLCRGTPQLACPPNVSQLVKQCGAALSLDACLPGQIELNIKLKILFIYTVFCLDFEVLQAAGKARFEWLCCYGFGFWLLAFDFWFYVWVQCAIFFDGISTSLQVPSRLKLLRPHHFNV